MVATFRSFARNAPHVPPSAARAVTPAWLEARLTAPDVRILDVRDASDFARGHVPCAVSLDVRAVFFDHADSVVSAPELAMAMSTRGVGDGHLVVLVDDDVAETSLAAVWALTRYGHRDVHVLEGGHARWVAERRAVSRAVVRHPPASFTARVSR